MKLTLSLEYGQKKIKLEQNALAEAWLDTRTLFLLSYMSESFLNFRFVDLSPKQIKTRLCIHEATNKRKRICRLKLLMLKSS